MKIKHFLLRNRHFILRLMVYTSCSLDVFERSLLEQFFSSRKQKKNLKDNWKLYLFVTSTHHTSSLAAQQLGQSVKHASDSQCISHEPHLKRQLTINWTPGIVYCLEQQQRMCGNVNTATASRSWWTHCSLELAAASQQAKADMT